MDNDTISRQAAIDAIEKVDDYGDGIAFEVLSHAQRNISLLPSAERRGRWIDGKCSVCEADAPYTDDGFWAETAYCPNCGASMEGEEE